MLTAILIFESVQNIIMILTINALFDEDHLNLFLKKL